MKRDWPSYDIHFVGNVPSVEQLFKLFVLLSFFLPLPTHKGFTGGASGKEPACNAGDIRDSNLIPGLSRSPGGGPGNPHQYSYLENPHGQRNLVGCNPKGHKESDTTEMTQHACEPQHTTSQDFRCRDRLDFMEPILSFKGAVQLKWPLGALSIF